MYVCIMYANIWTVFDAVLIDSSRIACWALQLYVD